MRTPPQTVTTAELPELLLSLAVVRPVFIWGPPGIGKSSIIRDFAAGLGLDCVSLLGTQLAPEDLLGVPQITEKGHSRFCPPEMIARSAPYILFLDELNLASADVQKSFYSLILEHRVGEYNLPAGSIVVAAGNRSNDSSLVRPMSSALINRLLHVHLVANVGDWLTWAGEAGIHPHVLDYIRLRPDHLNAEVPKTEEVFSTPRSWHMLSDALISLGDDASDVAVSIVAHGCVSAGHAGQFLAYRKNLRHKFDLDQILRGERRWPDEVADRDILYFLAQSLRARLVKELPAAKGGLNERSRQLAHRAKALLVELADISTEFAQLVVAEGVDGDDDILPQWFLVEVVRELPRLTAART